MRAEDDRFVEDEAQRLHRSKGAIVEAYAVEGIKTRRFPGVAFRGDDYRRRAWVIGSGLDVWEIVSLLQDFGSPEALSAEYPLTSVQIRTALAYAKAYPDEVDVLVARGRRPENEALDRYPFISTFEQAASSAKE